MKRTTMTMMAAAMLAMPVHAAATPAHDTAVTTPKPDHERAQELRVQAEALFSQPKQWRKAIRLLEESAELRDANDRGATVCLSLAGRIRSALGDYSGARQSLQKAGDHALARGSILEAAHSYLDAAHVAIREKNGQAAQELVNRALLLAESPLLTDAQRDEVTRRVAD